MREFKVGDHVIHNSFCGIINQYLGLGVSNMWSVLFTTEIKILYDHEIEFDPAYYREEQLKSIGI